MKTEIFYTLTKGGYLKEPRFDVLTITDQDEDFLNDTQFESFEDYVDYILDEAVNEAAQGFSTFRFLTEDEVRQLHKLLPSK
jgi:hypothetical protein